MYCIPFGDYVGGFAAGISPPAHKCVHRMHSLLCKSSGVCTGCIYLLTFAQMCAQINTVTEEQPQMCELFLHTSAAASSFVIFSLLDLTIFVFTSRKQIVKFIGLLKFSATTYAKYQFSVHLLKFQRHDFINHLVYIRCS